MTIQIGTSLPALPVYRKHEGQIAEISLADWAAGRRVVLITVPGAFTPTCSARHLPGYIENAAGFAAKGIEAIGCLAVNDAYVMAAWGEARGAEGVVDMLADPMGAAAAAMGVATVSTPMLGEGRAARLALVAEGGVITHLWVEKPAVFEVSAAEYVLARM